MSPAQRRRIADELRGWWRRDARRWWEQHADAMEQLAENEVRTLAALLRRGDRLGAYRYLVRQSDLAEWRRLRSETSRQLVEIAARRARMREALLDLGKRAAKLLGRLLGGL